MRRWITGIALLALTAAPAWAQAPQDNSPNDPPAGTSSAPRHYQRWRYSSYGVWVRTNAPGYPSYRYTYRGQKDNFPMPMIFQSGSEHTNFTWGSGLE